jgi:hypothetical protein
MDDDEHREFLLAALRVGSLRAKLMDAELTAIGVSLKAGKIDSATAVRWLREENLLNMITQLPPGIGEPDMAITLEVPDAG